MADHRKEEEADWESDMASSEESGDWEISDGMSEDKESSSIEEEDDRWSDFCRSPEQVPEPRSMEQSMELDAAEIERLEEERLENIAHFYSSEDGGIINEEDGGWVFGTEYITGSESEDLLIEQPAPRDLPEAPVSKEHAASGQGCAVCKDAFRAGERAAWLPCEHIFHDDCINPWLAMKSTCPVCRYDLDSPSGSPWSDCPAQGAAPAPQQDTCPVCGGQLPTDDVRARQDAPDQQDTIPICRCHLTDDVGARQGAHQQDTCPVCGRQLPTDAGARQDAPQQETILVCRCQFPTDDVGACQGAPQKSGGGGDNVRATTDEDYPMECSIGDEDGQQSPP